MGVAGVKKSAASGARDMTLPAIAGRSASWCASEGVTSEQKLLMHPGEQSITGPIEDRTHAGAPATAGPAHEIGDGFWSWAAAAPTKRPSSRLLLTRDVHAHTPILEP